MTDNEKIQSFGDMVDAVERLTKPIQEENDKLHKQLFWERIVLGGLLAIFIWFAYMSPVQIEQNQNLPDGSQTQSYSEGAAGGK